MVDDIWWCMMMWMASECFYSQHRNMVCFFRFWNISGYPAKWHRSKSAWSWFCLNPIKLNDRISGTSMSLWNSPWIWSIYLLLNLNPFISVEFESYWCILLCFSSGKQAFENCCSQGVQGINSQLSTNRHVRMISSWRPAFQHNLCRHTTYYNIVRFEDGTKLTRCTETTYLGHQITQSMNVRTRSRSTNATNNDNVA